MKISSTKIFAFFVFILGLISCKAQQVYPLNTSWDEAPNGSYLKDLSNELDEFVGTWKANYSNKHITLVITKELQQPFETMIKSFFKDQLSVRYHITNNSGLIVHTTSNNNFTLNPDFKFVSVASRQALNEVTLIYNGGGCSIGIGKVYLKKINSTQFQWNYIPEPQTLSDTTCPPGTAEPAVYLPVIENLVFTKQ